MTDKQPIDYPYVSVTDQIEQYNASTHPLQRTCSICAAAFTGFGGDPPVCPSCDTKGPQARCQSCFTPATLYPALNTRICIKCLAIIAKSILDSGLADEIEAQARREQREKAIAVMRRVCAEIHAFTTNDDEEVDQIFSDAVKEIESDGQ